MKVWFGKYRGQTIERIAEDDPDYLEWLRDQDWCKPETRAAIAAALGNGALIENAVKITLNEEEHAWLKKWLATASNPIAAGIAVKL